MVQRRCGGIWQKLQRGQGKTSERHGILNLETNLPVLKPMFTEQKNCNVYIPTTKKQTLCNSCYCTLKKLKEWSENIYRISPDPQIIDCLRNGHFGSIDLEPGLSHTVGPAGDAGSIDKSDINDTVIPEEDCILSSGVKRSFTDDHSYINHKGHNTSDSNDHEYSCNLHTEEDEEDDEDVNILCQDRIKQILKLLNLKSNAAYDYPSMLRTCSQTDLSEKDIFMSIIEEMKTRCPQLLEILLSVCVKDTTKVNLRQINSVAVAYSSLMFARNNKNSGIQRCITLLAVKGDANDEV
ncbi:uncharacterized protein LOC134694165 [Mytilus trossulus]|uniref:uncharacterized protein LOC134694165 n=1 Tax=Mytilus trossulus TaxID=6551 RepID=UPI003004CD1C